LKSANVVDFRQYNEIDVFFVIGFKAGNPWLEQDWSAENAFQPMQKPIPEEPEWTVADQNHDAILLIPDILARLVELLSFDEVSFGREVRNQSSLTQKRPNQK